VFRTYFINNRGDEAMGSVWSYLDMTALGRQEKWEDSPVGYPQTKPYEWWNWHDEYVGEAAPDQRWIEVTEAGQAAWKDPKKNKIASADPRPQRTDLPKDQIPKSVQPKSSADSCCSGESHS
jgi:hypothetical protein